MKHQEDSLFERAIQSLREAQPGSAEISASAAKVAERLGIAPSAALSTDAIDSCEDIRPLFESYRAGALSAARSLLVEAHLRECGSCLRLYRLGSPAVDWSAPKASPIFNRTRVRMLGWAFAASIVLLFTSVFIYRAYWQVPPGVRAEVQAIDGSATLINASGGRLLTAGARLYEGDQLRTSGASHAVLRLADGSTVEMNERSVVSVGARGHSMTVALDHGAVIVNAAKRASGHLYVQTADCRVAVSGTLFSVNAGIKGSSVAVLQGTVKVDHAGIRSVLHAGEQVATSDHLVSESVAHQISWSQNRDQYLQLLAQFSHLQNRIAQIPFPQPRYASDLLNRVPAGTLLYVSIPNLGEFVAEANNIFQQQLSQSPALQQWWNSGQTDRSAELQSFVTKVHDVSQYLGNEMVIVGIDQHPQPGIAVIADVQRGGLASLLRQDFPAGSQGGLTVLDEAGLNAASGRHSANGGYALVRDHEVVFSTSTDILLLINAQLNAGASSFATSDFGQQIAAAYSRGAGIILAANLNQIIAQQAAHTHPGASANAIRENSGIKGLRYLIAEHREVNGTTDNHLNLQFSGTRQRVASWLGSPAPMGSLDFVSTNAALTVAGLSKEPTAIADDLLVMLSSDQHAATDWKTAESLTQIDFRNDLAANLGGEFLFALDGPMLPTPSWKAVIEIRDSGRMQQTIKHLVQVVDDQAQAHGGHGIAIDASEADSQTYYAVRDLASGAVVAQYTYSSGYMIAAPTRALLMDALRIHASGDSLARSTSFRALLPRDPNENYSAIAYQNLSPVADSLLPHLSGQAADAIRELAVDSHPTAVCAWGKDAGIEAASNSRLFGFDFLIFGKILGFDHPQRAGVAEQTM